MTPWDALAQHLSGVAALDAQIYPTITNQLHTPCVVIMPDEPWIETGAFQIDPERYRVIAVVKISDGSSAQAQLHELAHAIRHNLPEGWMFENTSAPSQVDHQGITYVAVDTRLTFSECTTGTGEES